jgi:hypothetical protein
MKQKLGFGTIAFTMTCMYLVNSFFYGKVVGKLPFEPWGSVTSMTHRGIEGEDYSQFGMIFIYLLA